MKVKIMHMALLKLIEQQRLDTVYALKKEIISLEHLSSLEYVSRFGLKIECNTRVAKRLVEECMRLNYMEFFPVYINRYDDDRWNLTHSCMSVVITNSQLEKCFDDERQQHND